MIIGWCKELDFDRKREDEGNSSFLSTFYNLSNTPPQAEAYTSYKLSLKETKQTKTNLTLPLKQEQLGAQNTKTGL